MFVILCFWLSLPLSLQNDQLQNSTVLNINPKHLYLFLEHKDVLVEFYLSMCNTCPRMTNILDYYMLEHDLSSLLTFVSIDCSKYSKHCLKTQVEQYPDWMLIEKNGPITPIHNSKSLIDLLIKYNNLKSNLSIASQMLNGANMKSEKDIACVPGRVLKLNSNNFYSYINNGTFFVKLYLPSCISCIILMAIWKELAQELVNETKVCIAEYDCTATGMQICKDLEITRVPSLIWFKNGQIVKKYKGNRDKKGLRNFVSEMIAFKYSQSCAPQKIFVNTSIQMLLLKTSIHMFIYYMYL
uniref:Thioredoxin domain-containing protein 5 n=1 Tax=Drosophila rhopaloa TaxID=1041015 RepID=A0A6P4FL78_DRORH